MPRRILVDLPNTEQRLQILESHLKGEVTRKVDLASIAKKTVHYSGSDLKNVCVSAATTRVNALISEREERKLFKLDKKEVIDIKRAKDVKETKNTKEKEYVKEEETEDVEVDFKKRILVQSDFEKALKEIPASVSDGMRTLVELRKWDEGFGEGSGQKVKKGWGFESQVGGV